ncbi:hypothetical protein WUBG_15907, partial [Wuchereria bancrofti]
TGRATVERIYVYLTFEQIGLNYLSHLSIKSNTRVVKKWIALFTCFTTKSVHLEMAENLSVENCFACYEKV